MQIKLLLQKKKKKAYGHEKEGWGKAKASVNMDSNVEKKREISIDTKNLSQIKI